VIYATAALSSRADPSRNSDLLLVTSDNVARLLCRPASAVRGTASSAVAPIEPHIMWHERTHHDPAQRWMRDRILEGETALTRR